MFETFLKGLSGFLLSISALLGIGSTNLPAQQAVQLPETIPQQETLSTTQSDTLPPAIGWRPASFTERTEIQSVPQPTIPIKQNDAPAPTITPKQTLPIAPASNLSVSAPSKSTNTITPLQMYRQTLSQQTTPVPNPTPVPALPNVDDIDFSQFDASLNAILGELDSSQNTPTPTVQPNTTTQPGISRATIAQHSSASDCWIGFQNEVYDITYLISWHPGGPNKIIPYCGTVEEFAQAFGAKHGTRMISTLLQLATHKGALQ